MSDKILSAFTLDEGELYGILIAQMQSGKSGTYFRLALESVHRDLFGSVYIICGSRDTALRAQTKAGLEGAIETFCTEKASGYFEVREMMMKFKKAIKVYWNQDLSEVSISDKCLIINDESHTAQSKSNIPFKEFWKKNGLSACLHGDFSVLRERDVRVLSVSATSFSECVENQRVSLGISSSWIVNLSEKNVFIMEPGDTYTGVADFLRSENIIFAAQPVNEKTNGRHLREILRDTKYAGKYCIVRTRRADLDTELVRDIAECSDVAYKSIHCGTDDNLEFLSTAPRNTKLIHICGKFRMGQELDKTHIGFVYEQSKTPQIDTLLQGLLGRVCGHNANPEVDIFVSAKREREVREYATAVSLSDTECMAAFAKIRPALNVKSGGGGKHTCGDTVQDKSGKFWDKMVPVKFDKNLMEKGFTNEDPFAKRQRVFLSSNLHNLFTDHPDLLQEPSDREFILRELSNPKHSIPQVRDLCAKSYGPRGLATSLDEAHRTGTRSTNQFTNVVCEHEFSEVTPFTILTSKESNMVYFIGYSPSSMSKSEWDNKMGLNNTLKKCNFNPAHVAVTETGRKIQNVNGGQLIVFPRETSTNTVMFCEELRNSVRRSREIPGAQKEITSLWCNGSKEFKGIRLCKLNYTQENVDEITKQIESEFTIKIKFSKTRGRQPSAWFQYSSISWE